MADYNTGIGELNQDLLYDLRQKYAVIVGDHLEDIAQARKKDKYDIYFKTLKDLYIIVHHKFKNKHIKGKEINDDEVYERLVKEAVKLANLHPREWLGQAKNPKACAEIEAALNKIEMFLYKKVDDAGMFGTNKFIQGL